METRRKMKLGTSDKVILGVGYTLLGLFVLAVFVPLVYVVLASFMDPNVLNNQGLSFNFKDWTLDAYRRVLENDMIWRGFANSFFYSAAFTVISVFVTLLAAYPMSKKEFVGRKFFNIIFVITMFFGGGMIPTFILINNLHMVNTIWAILLPGAFNVWNMILEHTSSRSRQSSGRRPRWTGRARSSISSRSCCRCASRSSPCWRCGLLWECGTAILTP